MNQKRSKLQSLGLVLVFFAATGIVVSGIFLWQSKEAEVAQSKTPLVSINSLKPESEKTLAPGIPTDKVPEYHVTDFNYLASNGNKKDWNMIAKQANLYSGEKLIHSRIIEAQLFDSEGQVTHVTGSEAKFFINQRDLEVYGNVVTQFPDGFTTHSEYLRYLPGQSRVEIPVKYRVDGHTTPSTQKKASQPPGEANQDITFHSQGMVTNLSDLTVRLHSDVHFEMKRQQKSEKNKAETTKIESDQCLIDRKIKKADFTMAPSTPLKKRFVRVRQPDLFARGRRGTLLYGDFSSLLNYMTLDEDVLVKELNPDAQYGQDKDTSAIVEPTKQPTIRYSTCEKATFDTKNDLITLLTLPQVYQDADTVTGDVIVIHRDTELVEVKQGNAFNSGLGN